MGVKLRIAGRQLRNKPRRVILVHAGVLKQAKDGVRMSDAAPSEFHPGAWRKQRKDQRVTGAIKKVPRRQPKVHPEQVACEAETRDAPIARVAHQYPEHDRVQVKMEMTVDVVEWETRCAKSFKLRGNFLFELRAQLAKKEVADSRANRIDAEISVGINQTGNLTGLQRRRSADKRQVKADPQARVLAGQFDRFVGGRAIHHQAGGGKNAIAMGTYDGFIDGARPAKVVGVDDEPANRFRAPHSLERGRQWSADTRCGR